MTLFRVLSEEESKRVTRWQAPDLVGDEHPIVNTRQHARPDSATTDTNVRPLLGSAQLKAGAKLAESSAPKLHSISPMNVLANKTMRGFDGSARTGKSDGLTDMALASAEMMQSSFDEGHAKGYSEGIAALRHQSVDELRAVIFALEKADQESENTTLEQEVLRLSVEIARLVIKREVSIDPAVLTSIVRSGLEQLPGALSSASTVFLNPLDAQMVREHVHENDDGQANLRVADDPFLGRGDCRIESGASVVNAGLDDWLLSVSAQLGIQPESEDGAGATDVAVEGAIDK